MAAARYGAAMRTEQLPLTELEGIVQRCEAALFAGTSSHRDVVLLVEAEREILRRAQRHFEASVRESRTSRSSLSGASGGGLRT